MLSKVLAKSNTLATASKASFSLSEKRYAAEASVCSVWGFAAPPRVLFAEGTASAAPLRTAATLAIRALRDHSCTVSIHRPSFLMFEEHWGVIPDTGVSFLTQGSPKRFPEISSSYHLLPVSYERAKRDNRPCYLLVRAYLLPHDSPTREIVKGVKPHDYERPRRRQIRLSLKLSGMSTYVSFFLSCPSNRKQQINSHLKSRV